MSVWMQKDLSQSNDKIELSYNSLPLRMMLRHHHSKEACFPVDVAQR